MIGGLGIGHVYAPMLHRTPRGHACDTVRMMCPCMRAQPVVAADTAAAAGATAVAAAAAAAAASDAATAW